MNERELREYQMKQSIKGILISIFMLSMLFGQTYLIDETFGTVPPSGWTNGSPAWSKGTTAHDGDNASMTASSNGAAIVTYAVTDPDRITFWHYAGGGKPTDMSIGYATSSSGPFTTVTFTPANNTWTQYTEELSLPSGTYYFQFKLLGNKATSVDEFQVTQSIVRSTSVLTGFNYEPLNGPSSEQSFTVSGADLTENIVLNAPTNYEISETSGSGFGSSVTLTQIGGTVAATPIYVRLKSGLSSGSYNETITISSTGKINKTVSCSGNVRQSINPGTGSLTAFIAEPDAPSPEQSFTVSGQDLTANIVLNAPTNYEISTTSGSGFGSSVTLTQSGGTVSSTTIYVRLKSGLSAGAYNGENITISSTGKISKTVACSGNVRQSINPGTGSLTAFIAEPDAPSPEQSFTVSGQDLSANIVLTPPTNYEISTTSGSGFGSTVTLTQSGGTVSSTTIYVRLKSGLSAGAYNDENITISSTGKVSRTVTCSGDVRQSINPSTSSLSNLSYEIGYGPSSEQSFTVSGQDLTANIVLNAPTNYEISTTSGSGFGSSVTLTQSGGTVSSTTIYVRLKSGLSEGSYNSENITISSTGKITRTVTCSGSVSGPKILNVRVLLEGGF
jgi:hypothetical protein